MTKFGKTISIFVVAICAAVILPTVANAQLRNQNRYSKRNVSDIIKRLENSSNKFRRDFDKALDNSPINNTPQEDEYNRLVRNYENSLDRLRSNFDRSRNWWEVRNDVSDVVQQAQPVNQMILRLPFQRNIERQWRQMRTDLNTVADTYDMPGLDGGGWNGGWNGNQNYPGGGGWDNNWQMSRPPNWAVGTYYGVGPRGERITLAIQSNGRATSSVNGQPVSYGRYYRGLLTFGQDSATLVRTRNGIDTVSTLNRETISYSKQGWTDGGNDDWGNGSRPSSWAVGTFWATSPQDGSRITMTITNEGNVTVVMGNGAPSYGRLSGNTLRMGPYTSRLYRQGNGFRTVSDTDGQTISYTRISR
ncbi:MAG: hypothetical protein DYH05_03300 [Acidobacteria bacterium ACB1]|nr:hypothetical protein [Acidobacteria bacterium ACB1]